MRKFNHNKLRCSLYLLQIIALLCLSKNVVYVAPDRAIMVLTISRSRSSKPVRVKMRLLHGQSDLKI
jgi:hypothetical protein